MYTPVGIVKIVADVGAEVVAGADVDVALLRVLKLLLIGALTWRGVELVAWRGGRGASVDRRRGREGRGVAVRYCGDLNAEAGTECTTNLRRTTIVPFARLTSPQSLPTILVFIDAADFWLRSVRYGILTENTQRQKYEGDRYERKEPLPRPKVF
jgi:hypothetical protein